MSTQVLSASLAVTAGGIDLTPYLLDASWSYGLGPADATLVLTDLPTGVDRWDEVTITGGIVGRNVSQRFGGYVTDFRRKHWTPTVTLRATGYLGLASRVKALGDDAANLTDAQATAGSTAVYGTWTDPVTGITYTTYKPAPSTSTAYVAPGVDLTAGGVGQTDAQMVAQILDLLGLTAKCGQIGGTSRVLGRAARELFVWRASQTAAQMIANLDAISLGFRTLDAPDGTIKRLITGPRSPYAFSQVTLTEGVDVLDGAGSADQGSALANRVSVSGWDNRQGTRVAVMTCAHPNPPPGVRYETKSYNSELIERTFMIDPGTGMSCQEVALWHIREDGTLWTRVTVPTWRDDVIAPGEQVTLTIPHLAFSGSAWVESVRCSVTAARVWKQEVSLVARTDSVTEALLGQISLVASLGVNP